MQLQKKKPAPWYEGTLATEYQLKYDLKKAQHLPAIVKTQETWNVPFEGKSTNKCDFKVR